MFSVPLAVAGNKRNMNKITDYVECHILADDLMLLNICQ